MWRRVNRRSLGRWMRLAAVVGIIVQMLLVPAAQAQELGEEVLASPVLQCHPVVSADCAGGKVTLSGSGSHDLKIWLDNDTAHPLVDKKDVTSGTWTFDWSELGVDVCVSHKLKAKWSGEKSFGGSSCCSGNLLISHIECISADHKLEVHFVLNQSPSWPNYAGSSVSFSMSTPYGTVNGSAAFSNRRPGGVCHYYFYSNNVPDGQYCVTSGSLTVEGVTWNLQNSKCENITGCQEYEPCDEMTDWSAWVVVNPRHWDAVKKDYCVDSERYKYDAHGLNPAVPCATDKKTECEGYKPCDEKTDWSAWVVVNPRHWDAEKQDFCVDYERYKYDAHGLNPDVPCDTDYDTRCEEYEPCDEQTDWSA